MEHVASLVSGVSSEKITIFSNTVLTFFFIFYFLFFIICFVCVFIIFISVFDKYFPQRNINQSEKGASDKKLSAELISEKNQQTQSNSAITLGVIDACDSRTNEAALFQNILKFCTFLPKCSNILPFFWKKHACPYFLE